MLCWKSYFENLKHKLNNIHYEMEDPSPVRAVRPWMIAVFSAFSYKAGRHSDCHYSQPPSQPPLGQCQIVLLGDRHMSVNNLHKSRTASGSRTSDSWVITSRRQLSIHFARVVIAVVSSQLSASPSTSWSDCNQRVLWWLQVILTGTCRLRSLHVLNIFLCYQVVRPLGRKSVNKYLYLYL